MRRGTIVVLATAICIPFVTGFGCNPCGNGRIDSGEQCDDGNSTGGDGCSAMCQNESGQHCVDSTPAAFLQASRAANPGFDAFVAGVAGTVHFGTAPTYAAVCDEGRGPTTWLAVYPKTTGGNDDAVVVTRTDQQDGLRTWIMSSTGQHTARYYVPGAIFEGNDTGGFTQLYNADGTMFVDTGALGAPAAALDAPEVTPGGAVAVDPKGAATGTDVPVAVYQDGVQVAAMTACSVSPPLPKFRSCSGSAPKYKHCMKEHGIVTQGADAGLSILELIRYLKHGAKIDLFGSALYATIAFGPEAQCSYERGPCLVGGLCATGTCWGDDNGSCQLVAGDTLQLNRCDQNCEVCGTNPSGEPDCVGLEICDIPNAAQTCNEGPVPISVTYCGHVKPGNHLDLEFANTSCAPAFSCSGSGGVIASDGSSPAVFPDAIGCSGPCPSGVSSFTWAAVMTEVETGEGSGVFNFTSTCAAD